MEDGKMISLFKTLRKERLKRLEGLSGLLVPEGEMRDRRRKIVREFSQGGGV